MAVSEHTRACMRDLESKCARALNVAQCLIEASDPDRAPAWVDQFRHEVEQLTSAADRLVCSLNGVES